MTPIPSLYLGNKKTGYFMLFLHSAWSNVKCKRYFLVPFLMLPFFIKRNLFQSSCAYASIVSIYSFFLPKVDMQTLWSFIRLGLLDSRFVVLLLKFLNDTQQRCFLLSLLKSVLRKRKPACSWPENKFIDLHYFQRSLTAYSIFFHMDIILYFVFSQKRDDEYL